MATFLKNICSYVYTSKENDCSSMGEHLFIFNELMFSKRAIIFLIEFILSKEMLIKDRVLFLCVGIKKHVGNY